MHANTLFGPFNQNTFHRSPEKITPYIVIPAVNAKHVTTVTAYSQSHHAFFLLILSGQSPSYHCTMRNTFTRGNCRVEYVGNHNLQLWSEPKNASRCAKVHQFLIKIPGAWRVWQICYTEGLFHCFPEHVTIMGCAHRCYLSMWQSCHAQGNDKNTPCRINLLSPSSYHAPCYHTVLHW